MTTSAEDVAHTSRSLAILQPLPDQLEQWITQERPLPFGTAAQMILDAHQRDGVKADVVVNSSSAPHVGIRIERWKDDGAYARSIRRA